MLKSTKSKKKQKQFQLQVYTEQTQQESFDKQTNKQKRKPPIIYLCVCVHLKKVVIYYQVKYKNKKGIHYNFNRTLKIKNLTNIVITITNK